MGRAFVSKTSIVVGGCLRGGCGIGLMRRIFSRGLGLATGVGCQLWPVATATDQRLSPRATQFVVRLRQPAIGLVDVERHVRTDSCREFDDPLRRHPIPPFRDDCQTWIALGDLLSRFCVHIDPDSPCSIVVHGEIRPLTTRAKGITAGWAVPANLADQARDRVSSRSDQIKVGSRCWSLVVLYVHVSLVVIRPKADEIRSSDAWSGKDSPRGGRGQPRKCVEVCEFLIAQPVIAHWGSV